MTIGHGNWNGYKNGYKWRPFWCFLVLQECYRDAREASRICCGDAVVLPLLRVQLPLLLHCQFCSLSFTLLAAPSSTTSSQLTCPDHHNILPIFPDFAHSYIEGFL